MRVSDSSNIKQKKEDESEYKIYYQDFCLPLFPSGTCLSLVQ